MHFGKPTENSKILFVGLHGFLGVRSDWDPIFKMLREQFPLADFFAPNLLAADQFGPTNSFDQWSKNFNSLIESKYDQFSTKILLGYSMGGRLALHSLQKSPNLWSKLFLLSANPGLQTAEEREARAKADSIWAEKFKSADWSEVLKEWNAQSVFANGDEPERIETNYSREMLARALTHWSHAVQQDFRAFSQVVEDKLVWFVGEDDKKYFELMKQVAGSHIVVRKHSHRMLQSSQVSALLSEELKKI